MKRIWLKIWNIYLPWVPVITKYWLFSNWYCSHSRSTSVHFNYYMGDYESMRDELSINRENELGNNDVNIMSQKFMDRVNSAKEKWAPSSEFVSSSIPSWQILTAHAQPFRGARDLVFCLKVPLDSLLIWASSEGSGETARMRRLAWTSLLA